MGGALHKIASEPMFHQQRAAEGVGQSCASRELCCSALPLSPYQKTEEQLCEVFTLAAHGKRLVFRRHDLGHICFQFAGSGKMLTSTHSHT